MIEITITVIGIGVERIVPVMTSKCFYGAMKNNLHSL